MECRKISGILAQTAELKQLIAEFPDYPIAVLCGEEVNTGDYSFMFALDITFHIGELLDCKQDIDAEIVFTDREDFYEQLEECLLEKQFDGDLYGFELPEKEFQKILQAEKEKYEPYWKNCIFIYADV